MKKIRFISALALTMALVSCDNFDLPNPPGQANGEPDGVFENSGLVLAQGDANVDLKAFNAANQDVPVATVTDLVNFPADYDLSIDMQVSGSQNFANSTTVSTTIADNTVYVNPDVFNGAIQSAITKKPGVYDVYTRFVAYAERGTTRMRLGGIDAVYCPAQYAVTTLDPAKTLEDTYYVVPCAAYDGSPLWASAMKMDNTKPGASVYDNPEFAVPFEVTEAEAAAGYRWKLASQSTLTSQDEAALFGCKASMDNRLAGKLGAGYPTGMIELVGQVLVTVNVELDSYSVNYAFDQLWPLSSLTLSKPQNALLLYTSDYMNYKGVTVLSGTWYLCAQPSYRDGVVFQQNADFEAEDSEDGTVRSGFLASGGNTTALKAPLKKDHLYWCDINLVLLTYKISGIETMSVIGDGNGWDLETATPLTPSKDLKTWTAKGVTIGDMFKLNCNGAWDLSFGDADGSSQPGQQTVIISKADGGGNINSKPGVYDVEVNFGVYPYTVTLK